MVCIKPFGVFGFSRKTDNARLITLRKAAALNLSDQLNAGPSAAFVCKISIADSEIYDPYR